MATVPRGRAAGRAWTVEGEPRELPPGIDLAAYRVVQEALTNTLKHAGPARRACDPLVRADELRDRGRERRPAHQRDAPGYGLAGMRERVRAVRRRARERAAAPSGGLRVRARLPLGGAA